MQNRRRPDPRSGLPTPLQMVAHADRYVRGQSQAKAAVADALYTHYLGLAARDAGDPDPRAFGPQHLMLIGPTGTGKSYLVKLMAGMLGVPVHFGSAAGLVEAGYVGNQVESLVAGLLAAAGDDPVLAGSGIIVVRELDKVRSIPSGVRDVSGQGVQNALLTLLDGRKVVVRRGGQEIEVDTTGILFLFDGACVGLDAIRARRIGRTALGFASGRRPLDLGDPGPFESADLEEFGFIPELLGRLTAVVELQALSQEDLLAILEGTEGSVVERQRALFLLHGIELEFTPAALRAVAGSAFARGTGARGLDAAVLRALASTRWRLTEFAAEGVTCVRVTEESIASGCEPQLFRNPAARGRRVRAEDLRDCALGRKEPVADDSHARSAGISDARGWAEDRIRGRLEEVKLKHLEWADTRGPARSWWEAFERKNETRLAQVLRLAEELMIRKATVTEFFMAVMLAGTENMQTALVFMEFLRAKRREGRPSTGERGPALR